MAPISLRRGAKLLPARPKRTDHITCLTHQPSSPDLRPRPSHIDLTRPQMPGTHTRRGSGPSFGRRCPSLCPPDQLPPPSVLSSITRPKISATLHQFIAHFFHSIICTFWDHLQRTTLKCLNRHVFHQSLNIPPHHLRRNLPDYDTCQLIMGHK